jgi:pimeloyl-ACP methyl ester carboxylesterase
MVQLSGGFNVATLIINHDPLHLREKVVFFHGLGGTPEEMLVLEWLAIRLDVTILAPRLPCHGRTSDVETFEEFMERIAEWCDQLCLSNVRMIGHSLGALTLWHLAKVRRDLVSHAVLLAMPTKQPSGRIGIPAFFAMLGVDVSVTTVISLASAAVRGKGPQMLGVLASSIREGVRLNKRFRLVLAISDEDRGTDPKLSCHFLYGGADVAIRPPRERDLGRAPVVLWGQPHCFPLLRGTWKSILQALESSPAPAFTRVADASEYEVPARVFQLFPNPARPGIA